MPKVGNKKNTEQWCIITSYNCELSNEDVITVPHDKKMRTIPINTQNEEDFAKESPATNFYFINSRQVLGPEQPYDMKWLSWNSSKTSS